MQAKLLQPARLPGVATAAGHSTGQLHTAAACVQLPSIVALSRGSNEWRFSTRAEQQHLQGPAAGLPPNSFMHACASSALQVLLL